MSDQPTNRVDVTAVDDGAFVLVGDTDGGGSTMIAADAWAVFVAAAEQRGYDKAIAKLRTIATELDEDLEDDEITDPIGRLETFQIRLNELLKESPDHA